MTKVIPWVKFEQIEKNAGRFIVSPLKRGMGTTLGNSMRRVLISSLDGIAVTSICIDGVEHEFSTIKDVTDDVLDIICNIKSLVFKGEISEPQTIVLDVKGKKVVLAKDIKTVNNLEIINKEQYITELTSSNAKLKIEMVVDKGIGYIPAESNLKEGMPINTINIDSSFTPIIRVNHNVDKVRVGKELDYESLTLEVWTNGSIEVENAVKKAAEILKYQFGLFEELNKAPEIELEDEDDSSNQKRESALNLSIDDLELSARSSNCLKRAGIDKVGELVEKDLSELIQIKNFGKKSADEINEKLKQYNLSLKGSEEMVKEGK